MGSIRLKIKDKLNYRRGTKDRCCEKCEHKVTFAIQGIGKVSLGIQDRCELIGFITPKNVCNKFEE